MRQVVRDYGLGMMTVIDYEERADIRGCAASDWSERWLLSRLLGRTW